MKILVTGAAGFIGSRCAEMLAERGDEVVGIDNINDYYSPELKYHRLRRAGIETDASLPMGHRTVSSKWPNYTFCASTSRTRAHSTCCSTRLSLTR